MHFGDWPSIPTSAVGNQSLRVGPGEGELVTMADYDTIVCHTLSYHQYSVT